MTDILEILFNRFRGASTAEALIWQDRAFLYQDLLSRRSAVQNDLQNRNITAGSVVALKADLSPQSVATLLALLVQQCIVVMLSQPAAGQRAETFRTAQVEYGIQIDGADHMHYQPLPYRPDHPLYRQLWKRQHPGVVLFSSGTTGERKAVVHDATTLLEKYRARRYNLRTLAFMPLDHIGGMDTLFYALSNGSCLVTIPDRSPQTICRAIERHQVEVLPVSPTFLNLLLLSRADEHHDLSSLKYITYGAEVMPESTLKRCAARFPHVTLLQKYGTTETGTLRSKSERSDSLWVKLGGAEFQTRVVNGILQIKAVSSMLGYLNAPSPFTADGWFITGDRVEVHGDYLKILGRNSEVINVGGEKVYPAAVERVIQEIDGVHEVTVYGEKNPLLGNVVCAAIQAARPLDPPAFIRHIKRHCREHLPPHHVPVKIKWIDTEPEYRHFKKTRHV